jgi:hypothetical protein
MTPNPIRRCTACVLLVCCLPACMTYARTGRVSPSSINGEKRVILTVADSTGTHSIRLQDPQASHDSVWGSPCNPDVSGHGPSWRCLSDSLWSAPMAAVAEVRTKQRDYFTTSLVGLLAIGVTAAIVVMLGESARP